jgi:hypothetical protein
VRRVGALFGCHRRGPGRDRAGRLVTLVLVLVLVLVEADQKH